MTTWYYESVEVDHSPTHAIFRRGRDHANARRKTVDKPDKPKVQIAGTDGNIFGVVGACSKALRRAGKPEQAKALESKVLNEAKSYHEALGMCMEYVNFE